MRRPESSTTTMRAPDRKDVRRRGGDAAPGRTAIRAVFLVLPAAGLYLAGCSTVHPVAYPGRIVRTRVVDVTERRRIRPELVTSADSEVRVLLKDVRIRTIREVPVHEKVLHYVSDDDPTKRPVRIEVVPDEFVEGRERTRKETVETGPLALTNIQINGEPGETDPNGVYVDADERILSLFDLPARRAALVTFTAEGCEPATLRITREQLLRSLGIDPEIPGRSGSNDALRSNAVFPGMVMRGRRFDLRVQVSNHGKMPVWGLEGRLFSRHPWLNGRNFYFGRVNPGATRSFRRKMTVPRGAPAGVYYGVIGFWDWLGPVPALRIPVKITVEQSPTVPAPSP